MISHFPSKRWTDLTYAVMKPAKATKAALLLSSGSPNPFEGAIASYKTMTDFMGLEDMGIFTAAGEENKSPEKLDQIRNFAQSL